MACPHISTAEIYYFSSRKLFTLQNLISEQDCQSNDVGTSNVWALCLITKFGSIWPMFWNTYTPFPILPYFWEVKIIVAMTYKDLPNYIFWHTYSTDKNFTQHSRKHSGSVYNLYSLTQFETWLWQGQPIAIHNFAHFIISSSVFSNSLHIIFLSYYFTLCYIQT